MEHYQHQRYNSNICLGSRARENLTTTACVSARVRVRTQLAHILPSKLPALQTGRTASQKQHPANRHNQRSKTVRQTMRQSSYCEFKFIVFPLRHHLCVQKFERCSSAARPRCSMSMDSVVAFSL